MTPIPGVNEALSQATGTILTAAITALSLWVVRLFEKKKMRKRAAAKEQLFNEVLRAKDEKINQLQQEKDV
jgi:hypothetical protein